MSGGSSLNETDFSNDTDLSATINSIRRVNRHKTRASVLGTGADNY